MKMNKWLAAMAAGLVAVVLQGAEETPAKLSDVPAVVRDLVVNGMARGAPTTFFKVKATPPEGKWRAEYEKDGESHVFLITTRERVANGKTNIVIVRSLPQ